MNLFTFLQSIVSIAFIYLVLSLFTSEIQEYLAAIFESRAKRLKQSIRQMLGEQDYPFVPLTVDRGISIAGNSQIWIDPNGVIKNVKDISNVKNNIIFIKLLEEEKYEEVSQQIDTIQDVLNSNSHYYYEKGAPVIRHPIYTLFQAVEANGNVWENNGRLSVIKPEDIGKIDDQNIWINDNDNSLVNTSEVDQAKIHKGKSETLGTSIPVTQYPVFSNLGTISSGTKVWLSQGKINDVSIPKKEHYIYEVDGREVNETEVIEDVANPGKFYTVVAIVIKTPVYKIPKGIEINKANSYSLDIVNKTLVVVNQGNKVIPVQISDISQFGSLTEEIYRHRNIKALNQSGFSWLSLFSFAWLASFIRFMRKDWRILFLTVAFLLSLIPVVVSVLNKQSIDLRVILLVWPFILGALSYLVNQSEDDLKTKAPGRNRKSVGPSYIGADTFANTLLDILRYNTVRGEEDETKRLSTLFYTPAKPILGQWLNDLQTRTGVDLTPKQLVDGLREKYETAFNKVQERSSGVYKRNAKGLSFLLGLLLAILLNADTLNFVNKFTQADNRSSAEIFNNFVDNQLNSIPECSSKPKSVVCLDKQNAAFKALRGQFETLNKDNNLPLGWNTDTIQELANEIALLRAQEDTIKNACSASEDEQKCLDEINKLLQNNPELITIVNKDSEFINNLGRANSSVQKYQNLINNYKVIVKDKINQVVLNLKTNDQAGLDKIQQELNALAQLDVCEQGEGKTCFDKILEELKTNETLKGIINSNDNFKKSILEVNNINNLDSIAEKLKTKYTEIITLKEEERDQLVQAQAPTVQQVNTAVERQGGWLRVLFGWLITAIAISMGAPFWFDLIGRIVNVRNANKEGNTTGGSGSSTTPPPEEEEGRA